MHKLKAAEGVRVPRTGLCGNFLHTNLTLKLLFGGIPSSGKREVSQLPPRESGLPRDTGIPDHGPDLPFRLPITTQHPLMQRGPGAPPNLAWPRLPSPSLCSVHPRLNRFLGGQSWGGLPAPMPHSSPFRPLAHMEHIISALR